MVRSPAPSRLGVGMLGMGTVGGQVAARLIERREAIRRNTGMDLELRRVLVRDAGKPRPVELAEGVLTTDAEAVLGDPEVGVVVEVMGGLEPARSHLERALRAGKHVVTANKVVMAKHGPELLGLAAERNLEVYFEAAVGGGIPLISTFKVDLQANEIESIAAVINGTTNHMLSRMGKTGVDFASALAEAQRAGYAEADPTDDVAGYDARYKLAIMASIAFRTQIHPDRIYCEGIQAVQPIDFRYANELGYDIKLLAYASRSERGLEARVHPAMVPLSHPLGQVEGAFNAVYIEGDLVGPVLLYGQGAGGRPTASAVIGDLLDLATDLRRGFAEPAPVGFEAGLPLISMDDVVTRAYFRMRVQDRPGVLASIGQAFASEGVSISSAIQKEAFADERTAEFVVTTHQAPDLALRRTLERCAGLDTVAKVCSFLRVF